MDELVGRLVAELGPQDIRVYEVHDAFSIDELIYYDAIG